MANRRALGRGLQAGSDVFLSYFMNQMKEKQLRERQAEDDRRGAENAKALSEQRAGEAVATKFYGDHPVSASQRYNMPIAQEDAVAPIIDEISKTTKPESVKSLNDILMGIGTRGGKTWTKTTDPGGQGIDPLTLGAIKQNNIKRDQVEAEANIPTTPIDQVADDGTVTRSFESTRGLAGKQFRTELGAQQKGVNEGVTAEAAAPGKGKAAGIEELTKLRATWGQRFMEAQKLETMKAMADLDKKKKEMALTNPVGAKVAEEAASHVLQIEKITHLAAQINATYPQGPIDAFSGAKNAIGQLPYVGPALTGLMDTAGGISQSINQGDFSTNRKINELSGLRRAAAIALIRAAGDPRPSNADVDGVIGSIPGAFESLESTLSKATTMRQAITFLPNLVAANPGVTGKALLDLALAESAKMSKTHAVAGSPGSDQQPPKPKGTRPTADAPSRGKTLGVTSAAPINPVDEARGKLAARTGQAPTGPVVSIESARAKLAARRKQ